MKWLGQHIVDFIARFRSDVYLEGATEETQDHVVSINADDGKLYYQAATTGDITGVTITTDSGGGSKATDTAGSADFSILGSSGVGVTNSGTTITAVAVPGEIDHDSLNNFDANEHFTQANITTVGTVSSGTWQGTPIAAAYIADNKGTKHFGDTIKILPTDFMSNEDGGANKSAQFRDDTIIGVRSTHNDAELYAFVAIPEGKTATSVTVYGNDTGLAVNVYESDINAGALTDKTHASGCTVGSACDITDVASDATNYLAIKVTTTNYTNDIVYGGIVTIS